MKNAEILRMAKALLTPASAAADGSATGGSGSSGAEGDNTTDLMSLTAVTTQPTGATNTATVTVVTVAVDDPLTGERLRNLLETTVRLLYPKGLLAGETLPAPAYPLVGEGDFPLPDRLAAAAAYHTAWLLTGESRLAEAYERAMEIYYSSLEADVGKIVNRY